MPFTGGIKSKCRFLSIDGAVTQEGICDLKEAFLSAIRKKAAYIIDLTDITECDLPGLQLIYSLFQQIQNRGEQFKIFGVSPVMEELMSQYQLTLPESTLDIKL